MDRSTCSSFHHLQQIGWAKHGDLESIAGGREGLSVLVYQSFNSKIPTLCETRKGWGTLGV